VVAKTTTPAAAKTTTAAATKTTATAAKPSSSGAPKAANAKLAPAAAAATSASAKKTPPAAPASPAWTPDNPVAEKLAAKPTIVAKAKGVLPANADLNNATAGFKNFGQFVAAVNVSRNIGIPFADLKAGVTGVKLDWQPTGKPVTSLGGAIRMLKADADPMGEAQRATEEAEVEIGDSAATTTATRTPAAKATSAATAAPVTGGTKTPKKPVGQSASAAR